MGKDSFILYDNYVEQIEFLTDEQAGILLKAIYAYRHGKTLPEMDSAVNMAFSFIRSQLTRDQERYDEICEKRRTSGAMGGAPKGNQNAKKQAKQPNAFENNQNNQKQAKQPDNDNENDNDTDNEIKEKSTYVPKKNKNERTDERDEKQREFFETYPDIVIDNYSTADYAEIDFAVLLEEFVLSTKILQKKRSFKWICSHWAEISKGSYRDWETEMPKPPQKTYSSGVQCWEGD